METPALHGQIGGLMKRLTIIAIALLSLVAALAFAQGLDFSGHTGLPAGIDLGKGPA